MNNCKNIEYNIKIKYKDKPKTIDKISSLLITFLIENNNLNEEIKISNQFIRKLCCNLR